MGTLPNSMNPPKTPSQSFASYSPRVAPRAWQAHALEAWRTAMRGVVRVVTGGGKTTFAHFCMHDFWQMHLDGRVLILVQHLPCWTSGM